MNFVKGGQAPRYSSHSRACLKQRTRAVALMADTHGYRSLCRILSRLHLTKETARRPAHRQSRRIVFAGRRPDSGRSPARSLPPVASGSKLCVPPTIRVSRASCWPAPRQRAFPLTPARRSLLPSPRNILPCVGVAAANALLEHIPGRLALTRRSPPYRSPAWPPALPDLPDAVRNTDLLAEQLQGTVLPDKVILPSPTRATGPPRFLHPCANESMCGSRPGRQSGREKSPRNKN